MGLDQRQALPSDSYLQEYFGAVNDKLEIGAPLYVVIKPSHYDYANITQQNKICSAPGCDLVQ